MATLRGKRYLGMILRCTGSRHAGADERDEPGGLIAGLFAG
jgi:hypothetical protein